MGTDTTAKCYCYSEVGTLSEKKEASPRQKGDIKAKIFCENYFLTKQKTRTDIKKSLSVFSRHVKFSGRLVTTSEKSGTKIKVIMKIFFNSELK